MPLTGAAAARLYDDHVVAVHALIARRVGPAPAPSITEETFALALRTWDQFDTDRGTERLFLYGAATTTIRRHQDVEVAHLRQLRIPPGRPSVHIDDPLVNRSAAATVRVRVVEHEANRDLHGIEHRTDREAATVTPAGDDVPEARVMRAVANLDADDRDVLLLSLWESCSQNAIAETLSMSVSNVRSSLGRIRRELKVASTESA